MARESFEQFRQLVLQDTALQERLRCAPDRDTFLALVLRLGEERGYDFTKEDVEAAIQASQQAWRLRWI
jgi:predicted ribosomally synthesized peptide with nif11-like leader